MGGKGSGRWSGSAKRISVKECLRLTVGDLRGSGIIAGETDEAQFSWSTSEAEDDIASVRAYVTSRTASEVIISLKYSVTLDNESRDVDEKIYVVNANQTGSGKWYIRCPAVVGEEPCDQRTEILYLPPDQEYFACRRCHNLSYSEAPGKGQAGGNKQGETGDAPVEDETLGPWDAPEQAEQTAGGVQPGELRLAPSPERLFFYIDHTIKLLDPGNTTISDKGREKMVGELLSKMVREDGLSEERFSQAICEIQALAPKAFAAYSGKALREGSLSVGSKDLLAYFPLHRLGHILRLHLAEDLQVTNAADLLLVDTAVAALIQTRILLNRATPLCPENGISLKEEKVFRSQAVAQQKIFLSAMEKLQSKPSRSLSQSPAKKTG